VSPDPARWLHPAADGTVLRVRVSPGARRAGLAGLHGDALRVRVAAPPEGGAANRELVRLIAELLGVPSRDVEIAAGAGARDKRVHVRGLGADEVRARLASIICLDTPIGHG
jgi:uncharacterized protein